MTVWAHVRQFFRAPLSRRWAPGVANPPSGAARRPGFYAPPPPRPALDGRTSCHRPPPGARRAGPARCSPRQAVAAAVRVSAAMDQQVRRRVLEAESMESSYRACPSRRPSPWREARQARRACARSPDSREERAAVTAERAARRNRSSTAPRPPAAWKRRLARLCPGLAPPSRLPAAGRQQPHWAGRPPRSSLWGQGPLRPLQFPSGTSLPPGHPAPGRQRGDDVRVLSVGGPGVPTAQLSPGGRARQQREGAGSQGR